MLNSKAKTQGACWTTRTGIGNKLFKDKTPVVVIYEDETLLH